MAFVAVSANGRAVISETLSALGNISTVYTSAWKSRENTDFAVFANTGAVNTVGANTAEVQGSFDGSTWVTVTSSFISDFDTAVIVGVYDASANGDFPYYRLAIASAGNDSTTSAVFKVVGEVSAV